MGNTWGSWRSSLDGKVAWVKTLVKRQFKAVQERIKETVTEDTLHQINKTRCDLFELDAVL